MIWQIIKISLQSLLLNKVRSMLTMLGIIIGVSAVIMVVSLGDATQYIFSQQLSNLGPNTMYIYNKSTQGVLEGKVTKKNLTYEDATAIQEECDAVLYASPNSSTSATAIYRRNHWTTTLNGTASTFFKIQNYNLKAGRIFTDREVKVRSHVCVLGKIVKDNLFPLDNPLGKVIRIKEVPFKVIGVLKEKGQSSSGSSMDDLVVIPYTSYKTYIDSSRYVGYIEVTVSDSSLLVTAQNQMTALLRQRHKIKKGAPDDFEINTLIQLLKTTNTIFTTLQIFLIFIASISLGVGGIGIMNIMLVSVTERTREIGIRMAIGAKGRDILLQFIMEAVVLCLVGGFIGMFFGYAVTVIIELALKWKIMLSFSAVVVAIAFSIAVGVIFGFLPALRASKLDPIEALKTE